MFCCLLVYYCYCLASRLLNQNVSQRDRLVNTCLQILLHVVYLFVYFRIELGTLSTPATYAPIQTKVTRSH